MDNGAISGPSSADRFTPLQQHFKRTTLQNTSPQSQKYINTQVMQSVFHAQKSLRSSGCRPRILSERICTKFYSSFTILKSAPEGIQTDLNIFPSNRVPVNTLTSFSTQIIS